MNNLNTYSKFFGSIVALVTPMKANLDIDYPRLEQLIEFHIDEGTDAIVMVGTTGESPTINFEEHQEVIAFAVKKAAGRLPIIAGTGANSTIEAIQLSKQAEQDGADAVLSVVPYYNKPTQDGLYLHFKAIAESISIPVFLYNVPGRTVADLSNDTVIKLADIPNIVGIKDATASMERVADLSRRVSDDFIIVSGDDASAIGLLLLGGKGVISVTANVAPRQMHNFCAAALDQQWQKAVDLHLQLLPLHQKLFVESSPIPVKWACAKLGLIEDYLRLPLSPLKPTNHEIVYIAMKEAGVINE